VILAIAVTRSLTLAFVPDVAENLKEAASSRKCDRKG
jgi:hypothetical protein